MIVQPINCAEQIRDLFIEANRGNSFTWTGYKALFDYLEEFSDSIGEPYVLDVLAIDYEWHEQSIQEIIENYGWTEFDGRDLEDPEVQEEFENKLRDYTQCQKCDDGDYIFIEF
jgi:hypothetical protein